MSRGVARVGLDAAGGVQLGGGQDWWRVEGALVVVDGDAVAPHGLPPHAGPTMVAGSDWFKIDGNAVVAAGDVATCGHQTSGSDWMLVP
ncbi:MAG: hypothetical protein EAZ99_04045 [Alphaproteobacteria bacterium]|nr:MAG: hypothetical protein EAZ99_04045 [Alphaproteobacteria bacterium]